MFDKSSLETDTPAKRIRRMADACVEEMGFADAEQCLIEHITPDPQLVSHAIYVTARVEIRMAMAVRRHRILGVEDDIAEESGGKEPKKYSKKVREKVILYGKYLGWPLSTKKVLGEATLTDVRSEAEMYEGQASGNARNGRFMRLVEKRMVALKAKENEAVRGLLSDDQLARLMARARKAE
ncbi:MAG: hypothetical protein RLZZ403_1209 [Pseudomonadota bacterium]|jgi:hypothetical protein